MGADRSARTCFAREPGLTTGRAREYLRRRLARRRSRTVSFFTVWSERSRVRTTTTTDGQQRVWAAACRGSRSDNSAWRQRHLSGPGSRRSAFSAASTSARRPTTATPLGGLLGTSQPGGVDLTGSAVTRDDDRPCALRRRRRFYGGLPTVAVEGRRPRGGSRWMTSRRRRLGRYFFAANACSGFFLRHTILFDPVIVPSSRPVA